MLVGDVVVPKGEKTLHCGTGIYTHAIVGSLDPFILVSDDGTMLWCVTWEKYDVIALCQASEAIQQTVKRRIENSGLL